jgi:hypothetical protein
MALTLAYERGAQRARARAYGAGHIQALRHVFPVDVGLHSESAFWITRRITPDPRKAGELILSKYVRLSILPAEPGSREQLSRPWHRNAPNRN